jgi:hypothetical protein
MSAFDPKQTFAQFNSSLTISGLLIGSQVAASRCINLRLIDAPKELIDAPKEEGE